MSKIQIKDLIDIPRTFTELSAKELQIQGGILDIGLLISVGEYAYREGMAALSDLVERVYG